MVFAANWRVNQNPDFDDFIEWGHKHKKEIVIIGHRPGFSERIPVIILSSFNTNGANRKAQNLLLASRKALSASLEEKFSGKANIINIHNILCPDECPILDGDNHPLYIDASHLSMEGVRWVAPKLREAYPDIFSGKQTGRRNGQ